MELLVGVGERGELAIDRRGKAGSGLRGERDCSRGEDGKRDETHVHEGGSSGSRLGGDVEARLTRG